jgi:hypothetical protein
LQYQTISTGQDGDSVAFVDPDATEHGMRLDWFVGFEEDLDYNYHTDGDPPECGLLLFVTCYPPPPFDTLNLASQPLSGTVVVRAFADAVAPSFSIVVSADTAELHPWIPSLPVNGLTQALRQGDTAFVQVSAAVEYTTEDEVEASVTAEFLPNTNGHAHHGTRVALDDVPDAQNGRGASFGGLVGNPWTGFFEYNSSQHTSFTAETVDGELSFAFIAGTISGDLQVIVETEAESVTYADTLGIRVRVPGPGP